MTPQKSDYLVPPEQVDRLASLYKDFDKAFDRTRSRTAVDGALFLLAIVDELRQLRQLLEAREKART